MASQPWYASWQHPKGSVVIITGAGSGIGLATAILSAQQGYEVAAWDISAEGLKKTIELAGEYSSNVHPVTCDIASEEAVKAAMVETVKIGQPMMLVNNAGPVAIGGKGGFMDMTTAAMAMIHYPTTAFLETNPPEGAGIVNISSVVGPIFGGGGPWYSAAKAGIAGFTKNLAASLKGKVRVNSVAPGGPIRTPRNSKFIDEGVFKSILERNPTGRPGKPEELANGIMFLLSPAASYINGHMLVIDGGLSIAE
ncbi:NAD(P)-binding protein [Meredithblackwellia eburnea MCA 4105]